MASSFSIPTALCSRHFPNGKDSSGPQSSLFQTTGDKIGFTFPSKNNLRRTVIVKAVFDFIPQKTFNIDDALKMFRREKVKIGPLEVSSMGMGTWAWGNKFLWNYSEEMDQELQNLFLFALQNGVNFFDTADSYGTGKLNGRSEILLGNFIREFSNVSNEKVCIATKFAPYPWRLTTGQMVDACKASLKRLGTEKISIGQLHWSTKNYFPLQEKILWDSLVAMKEMDLVECIGVSNYGPKQLEKISDYLQQRGVKLASVQVQYSLLSQGKEQKDIKEFCDLNNIKLISYSPLALGLLTGKYDMQNLPNGPRAILFQNILPSLDPLLNEMRKISAKRNKTLSQIAINWCMCKGTIPIPGAKSMSQAQENLGAMGWRLSKPEVQLLDAAAEDIPVAMVQNIFQTN